MSMLDRVMQRHAKGRGHLNLKHNQSIGARLHSDGTTVEIGTQLPAVCRNPVRVRVVHKCEQPRLGSPCARVTVRTRQGTNFHRTPSKKRAFACVHVAHIVTAASGIHCDLRCVLRQFSTMLLQRRVHLRLRVCVCECRTCAAEFGCHCMQFAQQRHCVWHRRSVVLVVECDVVDPHVQIATIVICHGRPVSEACQHGRARRTNELPGAHHPPMCR